MDFKKLADKAKKVVDDRGGVDSLKEDAEELTGNREGQGQSHRQSQGRRLCDQGSGREGREAAEVLALPLAWRRLDRTAFSPGGRRRRGCRGPGP